MIRVRQTTQPRWRRDDEEPVPAGLLRAIVADVELRLKMLAGLSWYFPSGQPHTYPNKRFIRWVHWDRPLEQRRKYWTIMQFEWEKN